MLSEGGSMQKRFNGKDRQCEEEEVERYSSKRNRRNGVTTVPMVFSI